MDKTLLLTGASSGIGRETALLAAGRGWTVIVHCHAHADAAAEVVEQIARNNGHAIALRANLRVEGCCIDVSGGGFHIARATT
jgi:NAD(P)-dependent dehydrogenase (short-subunit alcohol dehydrogenase family)